ncbi:hypothetical protein FPQ18DRAFT_352638, partial [Pyronema domesticum]
MRFSIIAILPFVAMALAMPFQYSPKSPMNSMAQIDPQMTIVIDDGTGTTATVTDTGAADTTAADTTTTTTTT